MDSTEITELRITEAAAKRIAALLADEAAPGLKFRLAVSGGGCSGFQYGFSFDDQVNDDDKLFEQYGVGLLVDEASLELLRGSEVDFVEELIGASFQVRNPQAKSSCGCGTSFSL